MQHNFVEQAKQKGGMLRNLMVRGTKILLPFAVVIFCAHFALTEVEAYLGDPTAALVRWLVPARLLGPFTDGHVPGMSMGLLLLIILLFGLIASWKVSHQGLRVAVDTVVPRIPVLGGLYKTTSQIVDTFGDAQAFQCVVLIPLFGGRVPAFVTNTSYDASTGEKWFWVFLPMTPNPTSGFNFMVREKDSVPTDWTPQETLKRMMSLGTLMPESINFGEPPTPPAEK
jgi:uncharacterized membrane protein